MSRTQRKADSPEPPVEAAPALDLFGNPAHPSMSRVLLASLDAFAELGYHGTATRDIAKRAEMSAGALYSHFESKQALLEHISRATHQAMLDRMRETEGLGGSPAERLARVVRVHVAFHARNHTACRVANYELHSLSPENLTSMRQLRRGMEEVVAGILEDGVRTGDFRIDDIHVVTMFILSLGIDVSRWFREGHALSPEALANHYVSLVLAAVQGGDSPSMTATGPRDDRR